MPDAPKQQPVPQVPSTPIPGALQSISPLSPVQLPPVQQPFVVQLVSDTGKAWLDWLNVIGTLAIPIVVVAATLLYNYQQDKTNTAQHRSDAQIAQANRQNDSQIALDQQQETTLRAYLDDMSNLLLSSTITPQLHQANKFDEIRKVAYAKTLIVLESLDKKRKGFVVLFLYKADLITWHNLSATPIPNADAFPLVVLDNANLRGADLSGVFMDNADLHNTDLSGADLSNSILSYSNLSISDMRGANLKKAFLHGVDLHGSDLSGADLSGASLNCQPPAVAADAQDLGDLLICPDLNSVNLGGANLSNTNLNGADLSNANLKGAYMLNADGKTKVLISTVLLEQQTSLLHGATMPDGSIHP